MKAIVYSNYGSPEVLQCEEVEKPAAADDEVLIKVRAASVNPLDWHFMRGAPYMIRAMTGLRKPKVAARIGVDLAGQVEAVGKNVTQFRAGDEVFGTGKGALAEYVCASENKLALKPVNLTFEQAAAVPVAAITALQGLRDKGRIRAGQKVLINGAAGGVGTFAVQVAKSFGADVTGVCSTRNVEMVRSIGADHVIDYTREDFTQSGQRYDLMLDNVGNRSLWECRRVLVAKGILLLNGGGSLGENEGRWIGPVAPLLTTLVSSLFVSQKVAMVLASINHADLVVLKELMEAKKVTPVIDKCYAWGEVTAALRHLESGHARGKVVVTVEHNKH